MSEWQPIATAPKDGTAVLVFDPKLGFAYVCRYFIPPAHRDLPGFWEEAAGEEFATFKPTHWMPLPEPPAA